jgi:hypothetical protein
MDTLLCNWVIRALELGNSNFKLLLGFKLAMCNLSKHMKEASKYMGMVEKLDFPLAPRPPSN